MSDRRARCTLIKVIPTRLSGRLQRCLRLLSSSLRLLIIAGTIASAPVTVRADEFRLESATLPAPLVDDSGKVNVVIEASGVEPIGDGHRILVAHDKHPALFVVDVATGRIVGEPITSTKFPEPSKLGGPKWEGMARDADGNYYIIGAHVGKTDEERSEQERAAPLPAQGQRPAGDRRRLGGPLGHRPLARVGPQGRGPGRQGGRPSGRSRAWRSARARRPTARPAASW